MEDGFAARHDHRPDSAPTTHDSWKAAMLDGDFERAWRISDAVLEERSGRSCDHLPRHLRWVWDGTPLDERRVRVRCYHGLGDTLQFIRFVPLLATRARSVSVEAQSSLLPLLRSVPGIAALYPIDRAPDDYEVAIELMELPHALRVTLETLPAGIPYLIPPDDTVGDGAPRGCCRRMRVGLVWAAGDWRRERSLPPALLVPLTRLPLDLFGLQLGPARHVPEASVLTRAFIGEIGEGASIAKTARTVSGLDLVVTVDTMATHLAGALGRPVWTLLDALADWRWMRNRADSPWYPTMRLYRQPAPGEWRPVVAAVTQRLAHLARASEAERAISASC